ncbi:NAD(P)/FAD-dependent oxidoreductase [Albidovulum sediminis]|uniref:NAD(P)/FAD-dependent oxidoreductase n=1 Tax=Albidovulum sediminis TaxID=3066345 RepID=A0ABT2NGZ1_9RHOB|nr:NAD(P)/FAD-dependent oxidoreductase [Defluviimonas sediminis]MCT8328172.1 NAD(P)/FAD-dependent oxidoreductase [Defluviimonas sediminis]
MTGSQTPNTYDAIVVGARCAGAAVAMLLARQGARVLAVDHDQPGTDTMSTHALMRGAVFQLRKWGVLAEMEVRGTPAIRRTSFLYGDEAIDIDLRMEHGIDALLAPRRAILDAALAGAAAAAGAELRYGTGLAGLVRDAAGRVCGAELRLPSGGIETVRAPIVIGADGRRSAVARLAGAGILHRGRHAAACAYRYVEGLPNRGYRWHYAAGAAGGVIPTNEGLSCVFVALPPPVLAEARAAGWEALLRHVPTLGDDLASARPVTAPVVFPGLPGYFRQSAGPGWALVGDAGYFRDPITAHGITDAFRDAEILAGAVVHGRVADYPLTRDALSRDFFELTDRLASFDWTLAEAKVLHQALNKTMKANQNWIAGMGDGRAEAA